MIVVRPYEDELVASHAWRRQHVLGYASHLEHRRAIREQVWKGKDSGKRISTLDLMAAATGMNICDYTRQHTLLPVRNLAYPPVPQRVANLLEWHECKWVRAMALLIDHARICPNCIKLDRAKNGVAWFRRAHQLVGVDWCHIHESPLRAVRVSSPFTKTACSWVQLGAVDREPNASIGTQSGWRRRFNELSVALLGRRRPVSTMFLHPALARRLECMQFVTRLSQKGQLLSDFIYEQFSAEPWILEKLGLIYKHKGQPILGYDGFPYGTSIASRTPAYVAALVTVCSSTADALSLLSQCEREEATGKDGSQMLHHHPANSGLYAA